MFSGFFGSAELPVLGLLGVGVTLGVVEPLEGLSAGLLDLLGSCFPEFSGFLSSGLLGSCFPEFSGFLSSGLLGSCFPEFSGFLSSGLLGSCFPEFSGFLSSGLLGFSSFFLGSTFSLFFVGSSFFVQEVPPISVKAKHKPRTCFK